VKVRRLVSNVLVLCFTACAVITASAVSAFAAKTTDHARAAVIDDLNGAVKVTQDKNEMIAFKGLALLRGNELGTGMESWSRLEIDEGRFAIIEENTNIQITALADGLTDAKTTRVYMSDGKVWFDVAKEISKGESFEVKTPTCALSVRGTVFCVTTGEEETTIAVYNGKVAVRAEKKDGTPLLDRRGNEVYMEVSSGKAKITAMLGSVFRVTTGELALEDLVPFLKDGGNGAGGVYAVLRGHMSSNKNFLHLLQQGVNDMTPAKIPQVLDLLNGRSASGMPRPPVSLPVPRIPW